MKNTTTDAKQHAAAVVECWLRHGRQAAAELLVEFEGCTLADSRAAAELLREQVTSLWEPVIETANWLRNVHGHSAQGTL